METMIKFESSWGTLVTDESGNVLKDESTFHDIKGENNYLADIKKVDLEEYKSFIQSKGCTLDWLEDDICNVGFWKTDGSYEPASKDWRKNMF